LTFAIEAALAPTLTNAIATFMEFVLTAMPDRTRQHFEVKIKTRRQFGNSVVRQRCRLMVPAAAALTFQPRAVRSLDCASDSVLPDSFSEH
jgi:hypothetical protein